MTFDNDYLNLNLNWGLTSHPHIKAIWRHDRTRDSGLRPSLKNICKAWSLNLSTCCNPQVSWITTVKSYLEAFYDTQRTDVGSILLQFCCPEPTGGPFVIKYTFRCQYANSVDPDQTASNSPSDQGPHFSLLVSIF